MIIKLILLGLIKIAAFLSAPLPDHTIITWPDTGPIWSFFNGLGSLNQLVDMTSFLIILGIALVYILAKGIYVVVRLVYGLIPAFK